MLPGTLESTRCIEWLSEDTFISHNVIKRVWPASQRDALFWSHIRHVISDDEEKPDLWIVVNYSTDNPSVPVSNSFLKIASLIKFLITRFPNLFALFSPSEHHVRGKGFFIVAMLNLLSQFLAKSSPPFSE